MATVQKRPFSYVFSGNPIHYQLYSALAANDQDIYFEYRVAYKYPTDVAYSVLPAVPYSPTNGVANIDVRAMVNSILEYELPTFSGSEKTAYEAKKQTASFYLEYREISAANPDPSWDKSELDFAPFVIKGGMSYMKYRGNNFWINHFGSLTNDPIPFLTWQLSGRLAALNERMYLGFLNDTDIGSGFIRAVAKCFYTDGSTATVEEMMPAVKGNVYYVPAGAEQWGLPALDVNKVILQWSIQLKDYTNAGAPVPVTDPFFYEADNRNDYNQLTLNYRNSLGCIDSARVRGVITKNLDYTSVEISKTTGPDYYSGHFVTPQQAFASKLENLRYKGDLGPLEKEEQDRLRELQLGKDCWWEVEKKWLPVKVLTSGFALTSSEDTRWSMPIEFQLAVEGDPFYTPENFDLGDAVFVDNTCLAFFSVAVAMVDDPGDSTKKRITISAIETDPADASTQFRWRIDNEAWQTVNTAALPLVFSRAKEALYNFEMQALCANGVYGAKSSAQIDTRTPVDPGPDPDPGTTLWDAFIENLSASQFGFSLVFFQPGEPEKTIAGGGVIGTNNKFVFKVEDTEVGELVLQLFYYSPSHVTLFTNGASYMGTISGNVVTFKNVKIVDGLEIKIYG